MSLNSTLPLTKMDDKLIQRVLQEYKIHNCEVCCGGTQGDTQGIKVDQAGCAGGVWDGCDMAYT